MEDLKKKMRQECWDKALDSFAYSYIYSKKTEHLNFLLRWTKLFGILIPVMLGALLTAYYGNKHLIDAAIYITTPFAIAQLILSTYLTVIGADEKVNTYISKSIEYTLLNSEIDFLVKFPDSDSLIFQNKYEVLNEREKCLGKGNYELSEKDLRMGMRFGLRQYRRPCVGCNEVPVSMKPSKCEVCGNF
jgi:mobilome CxxCx(11)CxxC protein